jgi:predicted RNA binding protein YcfA (HicA-like mRNA interferase family)
MTADQVIVILEKHGWKYGRTESSHHIYVKPGRRSIAVPKHGNKDIGRLANRLFREAGIKDWRK